MNARLRFLVLGSLVFATAARAASPLFAIAHDAERRAQLVRELINADAGERARWIERIDAETPCAARDADRLIALEFWALAAPRAAESYALRFVASPARERALLEALARGLTRADPSAAWAWSQAQPARDALDLRKTVLETVAEIDPEKGLLWLREESGTPSAAEFGSPHSERACAFFRALTGSGDFTASLRLVDRYPAGVVREQLLFLVGDAVARYAWPEAAAWARSRAAEPDAFYSSTPVALHRAREDWAAALNWIAPTENDAVRARLVRVVAGEVLAREPTPTLAARILAKLERGSDRDAAFVAFAASAELVRADPRQILDWAWSIAAPDDRRRALIRGYANWTAADEAAARAHLAARRAEHAEDCMIVERFLTREKS